MRDVYSQLRHLKTAVSSSETTLIESSGRYALKISEVVPIINRPHILNVYLRGETGDLDEIDAHTNMVYRVYMGQDWNPVVTGTLARRKNGVYSATLPANLFREMVTYTVIVTATYNENTIKDVISYIPLPIGGPNG